MPIDPWWETNLTTTPRQELGMVSPELLLSPELLPELLEREKDFELDDRIKRISLMSWKHVNFYGEYSPVILQLHRWSLLQVTSLELESKLVAWIQFPKSGPRERLGFPWDAANWVAATGFVQRPAISPRRQPMVLPSSPEIAAE